MEERKLASVQMISDIKPIEGADRIEVATVEGWHVVISKSDNFHIGDKVVYIEIDSVVPAVPMFEFLKERDYRVRTIKLRKQVSEGLILPISVLKGDYAIGTDVTKELGITKYDPQAKAEKEMVEKEKKNGSAFHKFLMKFSWYRKLYFEKNPPLSYPFPEGVEKTDEIRIQNLVEDFEKWKGWGLEFSASEKVDGVSSSFVLDENDKFHVCSRNYGLSKANPVGKVYWEIAEKYDMKHVLTDIRDTYYPNAKTVVIQGEILGKNIQGDKYHLPEHIIKVYNLKINGELIPYKMMKHLCDRYHLPTVDVVVDNFVIPHAGTIDDIVNMAKGVSLLDTSMPREGLVFRSKDYRISFKAINPDFLLKYKND
jgi:hypothetical protein